MYSINFLYTAQVIVDHIPSVLRKVFINRVDPLRQQIDLGQWLKSNQVQHPYHKKEKKPLKSEDVEKGDTTLLCRLLLYEDSLIKLNGAPFIGERSSNEYKAVDQLRQIRNDNYGHLSKAEVSDDILQKLIEDVNVCYTDLKGHGADENDLKSLNDIPKSMFHIVFINISSLLLFLESIISNDACIQMIKKYKEKFQRQEELNEKLFADIQNIISTLERYQSELEGK